MSTRGSDRCRSCAGFSLAEVLLAIFLLGMIAVGISALLGQLVGSNDTDLARLQSRTQAVAVMESLLTQDYSQLGLGTVSDSSPSGMSWTITVSQEAPGLRKLVVVSTAQGESCRLESMTADRLGGLP